MSLYLLLLLNDLCLILNILYGFLYQGFDLILFILCVFRQYFIFFIKQIFNVFVQGKIDKDNKMIIF